MVNNHHIFTKEDGRVKIKGIYVGLPIEKLKPVLLEQGFSISSPSVFVGDIEGLGNCRLTIREGQNTVGLITIRTERKCSEEEVRAVIEQVNNDLHATPGFDYNGFGIAPKPHEIDHFWDTTEGLLKIMWDGFNIHGFSSKNDDGLDYITIWVQGPVVKDEEYWRSEVD
jgi:hypothetical protein